MIFSTSVIGRGGVVKRRRRHFAGETRLVVLEEPAVLDDVLRDRIETLGELRERDLFAASNALDQAEVGRRQQADVLRVLAVDLLDALGDDELDAGRLLGVRRGLARRAAALREPGDDDGEAAVLDLVLLDRAFAQADETYWPSVSS